MIQFSLVSSLLFITFLFRADAQSTGYHFSQRVEPYQPLELSSPISDEVPWYSESWTIPIGFPFYYFDEKFDSVLVFCASSLYFGYAEYEDALQFAGFSQAIADRGWETDGGSLSPISYLITGIEPNRICKVEFKNAGFDLAPTTDSVNLQIWLFETSNAIEVHLGPHYVSSPASFNSVGANGPFIGLLNSLENQYELVYGNTSSPEFGFPPASFLGLSGNWPDGQTYRFSPNALETETPMPNETSPVVKNLYHKQAVLLQGLNSPTKYQIYNAVGNQIKSGYIPNAAQAEITYSDLSSSGWHVLKISTEQGGASAFPFLIIRQ